MKLTGNKGEWSELYAFVKLLSTGKLYAADEKVNRIPNLYFPILKILRTEEPDCGKEYVIRSEDGAVEVHCHGEVMKTLSRSALIGTARYLYDSISVGGNRAFAIDGAEAIMQDLTCSKISAPSTDKTDITMQLHDLHTGYDAVCGFSIKSEMGSPPTLLNASGRYPFIPSIGLSVLLR